MPTVYMKIPQVKAVIDQSDISCEEKIDQIRKLAEGKKVTLLQPGQSPNVEKTVNEQPQSTSGNPDHVDKILSEVNGVKEKQLAAAILGEIEKSEYISYDVNSWELIVANETIKFTNVIALINFVIGVAPNAVPLGLAIFMHALLKIKVPFDVVKNGDAINCRENLIKISELENSVDENSQNLDVKDRVETVVTENGVEMTEGGGNEETGNSRRTGKKRERESDGEDLNERSVKRSFGVDEKALEGIRRSPRLRQNISEAWSTKKKKNGKNAK